VSYLGRREEQDLAKGNSIQLQKALGSVDYPASKNADKEVFSALKNLLDRVH
jgi:hypothetical protein